MGSGFVLTFYVVFITAVSFFYFDSVIKLFGLGLSFDFLVFYLFFFGPINSLQKNKLSSS